MRINKFPTCTLVSPSISSGKNISKGPTKTESARSTILWLASVLILFLKITPLTILIITSIITRIRMTYGT